MNSERHHISRIVRQGRAAYVLIPAGMMAQAALKIGDRLAVTLEGGNVLMRKIPFEALFRGFREARERDARALESAQGKGE